MTACKDFDLLLPLHAAGALDPAEAARVDAHLAACAACRAEAVRDAEALGLAKLPPPTDAERRALAAVPRRALAALRRGDVSRVHVKRVAAFAALLAAAVLALLAPALFQKAPQLPAAATVAAAATWEEPDLDTIWDDAGVLDLDGSAAADADEGDVALAAMDL